MLLHLLLLASLAGSGARSLAPQQLQVEAPDFDTVISVQGNLVLDTLGRQVGRPTLLTESCARLPPAARRPPAPRTPVAALPQTLSSAPPAHLPFQVHAHGGQLLREGGAWWWVGTSRKVESALISHGIYLYRSTDLSTWEFR